jgi:hypothetical protein
VAGESTIYEVGVHDSSGVVIGDHNTINQYFNTPVQQTEKPRKAPFLVPPQSTHKIVGRDALLVQLKQKLLTEKPLSPIALYGLPGVGKGTVIKELVYDDEVRAYYTDGILWASLGQAPTLEEKLAHLGKWGEALGISTEEIASSDLEKRKD